MFGICNLAIVPLRENPSDKSEQVSQLLFGEHFKIIEKNSNWIYIELAFDGYLGWIDAKQFQYISEEQFNHLNSCPVELSTDLVDYVHGFDNQVLLRTGLLF